jgi:Tfp pilus assembly protein FimT
MIVVAIMMLILGMSVPFAKHALHKEGLNKALADIVEVCSNARARAIMQGAMAEVVVHADPFRLEVGGGGGGSDKQGEKPSSGGSGLSATIDPKIGVAALWVNGVNCRDYSAAHIRFYPNGTCDELRMVLLSETLESRGIFLEVTTGLATIESDPQKLATELPR